MASKKGRRYEHDVANGVTRSLDDVIAWPIGYSGNNAVPCPDVLVIHSGGAVALELKTTNSDTFGIEKSDLEQLLSVQKNWMDVALLINFSHREPIFVEPKWPALDAFSHEDVDAIENFKLNVPDAFEPRRTDGGDGEEQLRLSRPSTDEWPSARDGRDSIEVIQASVPTI